MHWFLEEESSGSCCSLASSAGRLGAANPEGIDFGNASVDMKGGGAIIYDTPTVGTGHSNEFFKPALPPLDQAAAPEIVPAADAKETTPWKVEWDRDARLRTAPWSEAIDLPIYDPVMAARNGPYALIVPPYTPNGPAKSGELIDLRTGETAGSFEGSVRYHDAPCLSPDGTWLVGAMHGDELLVAGAFEPAAWRRGEKEPTCVLPIDGQVLWCEFVSNDEIAIYTAGESSSVKVWNLTTGTLDKNIALTGPSCKWVGDWVPGYSPSFGQGAVSPDGRLIAIAGAEALRIVDRVAGKMVGQLPIPITDFHRLMETPRQAGRPQPVTLTRSWNAMGFSDDGRELYVLTSAIRNSGDIPWLLIWSMETGRLLHQREMLRNDPAYGRLSSGPVPGTILASGSGGTAGDGAESYFNGAILSRFSGLPVMSFRQQILRCDPEGRCLVRGTSRDPALPATLKSSTDLPADRPEDLVSQTNTKSTRNRDKQDSIFVTKLDMAGLTEITQTLNDRAGGRPAAVPVDRSSTVRIAPEPPAQPGKLSTHEPLAPLPARVKGTFVAHQATRALAVRYEPLKVHPKDFNTTRLTMCQLYDSTNGQPIGDEFGLGAIPDWLFPVAEALPGNPPPPGIWTRIALSVDGSLLAVTDPANPQRVDIWTTAGQHRVGWEPSTEHAEVEWSGWTPDGQLVTVSQGIAAWWTLADNAVSCTREVDGGYTAAVAPPGSLWMVAGTRTGHLDALDLMTGHCLARAATAQVLDPIESITVSSDGRYIVAVTKKAERSPGVPPEVPAQMDPAGFPAPCLWLVWEPSVGTLLVSDKVRSDTTISWFGNEHIYNGMFPLPLVDLKLKTGIGTFAARQGETTDIKTHPVFAADRKLINGANLKFKLDIDLGAEEWSQHFADRLVKEITKSGLSIGPGGWTYEVRFLRGQVDEEMHFGKNVYYLPIIDVISRLIDPSGKEVAREQKTFHFLNTGSRYYFKTETKDLPNTYSAGDLVEITDYYDFPSDMKTAVTNEILEHCATGSLSLLKLPSAVLESQRGSLVLPTQLADFPQP